MKIKPRLRKCTSNLYGYSSNGKGDSVKETLGEFDTRLNFNGNYKKCRLVVTRGNAGNLLGYNNCVAVLSI